MHGREICPRAGVLLEDLLQSRYQVSVSFLWLIPSSSRSLLLSSHSTHFPWCLGPLSLKKLAALEVKYLTLENMMALDGYGEGKSLVSWPSSPNSPVPFQNCVDLASTRYIHLRVDPTHKQDLSNFLWVDINGKALGHYRNLLLPDGLLSRLLAVHERCLEFRAYSECPLVLSMITAEDMCSFIRVGLILPVGQSPSFRAGGVSSSRGESVRSISIPP